MTEEQHDEIHEINLRLDRVLGGVRWVAGIAVTACIGLVSAWVTMEGRVASLEASRDATVLAIERIDRNVEDIGRYLRDRAAP